MAALKSGSKGKDVTALQENLNKAGVKPKLNVDGKFGKKTETAVKDFQKKKNLKADGVVGKKTESALGGKGGAGSKGGAGGKGEGKGKHAAIKSPTRKKVNQLTDLLYSHWDACLDLEDAVTKAYKDLKGKSGLSDQQKARYIKPLEAVVAKAETSQAKFVAGAAKAQVILGEIDQKADDRKVKALVKLGQSSVSASKGYASHSKTTKQKSATLLEELAEDDRKPLKAMTKSFDQIYSSSRPSLKFTNAWLEFVEQIQRMDKSS